MPDRISQYRQVRLIIDPVGSDWSIASWHVHLLDVRKGIPYARCLASGDISIDQAAPSSADIWRALADVTNSLADPP